MPTKRLLQGIGLFINFTNHGLSEVCGRECRGHRISPKASWVITCVGSTSDYFAAVIGGV